MRTKIFTMSMGLAASVWLIGCQSSTPVKTVTVGSGSPTAVAKSSPASGKDSPSADLKTAANAKTEKTTRLAKGPQTTSLPAAACETCVKCKTCGADTTGKGSTTAASCSICAAKTGSVIVAPSAATLPAVPNQPYVLPAANPLPHPATLPPAVPVAQAPVAPEIVTIYSPPQNQPPLGASFGPGVEVVSATPTEVAPAAPSEKTVNSPVMTVRFGQANNYQTVVGQVYQFRRTWKLRYTAVESEDRYGGSFTLVGDNLDHLKDGQMVRVEGSVIPSDDRASGVRYQVGRVEILEPDLK